MQPQYTITLSREEIKHNPTAYTVTDTGQMTLLLNSDDDPIGFYVAVNYGQRKIAQGTADMLIRRHLAHAWHQIARELPASCVQTRAAEANRALLITMARELYERDHCALADLLAEACEQGTRQGEESQPAKLTCSVCGHKWPCVRGWMEPCPKCAIGLGPADDYNALPF